jgi:uncharacterized membrane protein YqgA involved in biofilm formation
MLGPVVNAVTVVVCSLLGYFVIRGIPERIEETLKKTIGLAVIYIGIQGAMENQRPLLLIMSIVGGALLGELINFDLWINRLGLWAEQKLYRKKNESKVAPAGNKSFAKGFVSASILFCTGSMVIVGSLQSGLQGNHSILFTKSILDGTISIVFAASLGIGVLFSAIPVIVIQGGIVLLSHLLKDYLTPQIITEMAAVGNLIVAAIGINFACLPEGKEIRVANLVPAIFIPWAYLALEALIHGR